MTAIERITMELNALNANPVEGWSAGPKDSDPFVWRGAVEGPGGTPYEGGWFFLDIYFPQEYPFRPPKVKFETRIYHLNVDEKGATSVSILKDGWSPTLTMSQVLLKLRALLVDPEPDNPMRGDLSSQWQQSRADYDAKAREFTAAYAM